MPRTIALLAPCVHTITSPPILTEKARPRQCSGECLFTRSVRVNVARWMPVGSISCGTGFRRTVNESAFILCKCPIDNISDKTQPLRCTSEEQPAMSHLKVSTRSIYATVKVNVVRYTGLLNRNDSCRHL